MDNNEKLDTIARITVNPFAFLELVKIQEPGKLVLEYQLWPHLIDFYRELENQKLIDLIKAKQIGVSWALAIHALRKIMTVPGMNVLEISQGEREAQSLLVKSRIVFSNMPDWIKNEPAYELEFDSTEKFGFKNLHSRITALPSKETSGIGETAGLVIHDESDFHDYYEVNLSHTSATVADSPDRQLISVSTVDKTKPDSYFKTHWKAARDGQNGFKALFYGYDVRPNRDEAWYQKLLKENEATPWVVEANYPRTAEEALSPQTATSCFNKERLDKLWYNSMDNPDIEQGFIYILYPPRVGTQYVAGVDVGEGVGLDYSCTTVVGKNGMDSEVVAVIYTNTLGTDSFAFETDRLCRKYLNAKICLDNIGIGKAVADKLEQLGYPNLYRSGAKDKIGWSLTRPNKRDLAVKLIEAVNNGSLTTRFKPQVSELMEYQWIKGYPEPTGKTHGDTVISLMFANEMLKHTGVVRKASMYVGGKKLF